MSQWWVVYLKEVHEMWRNRKWIWIPIVFMLMGVMQPITMHFMPQILKMSGNMPAGTVIQIPTPSAGAVLAKSQSQYGVLGLLIVVLAFMGAVSSERQRGVLEMVLVKPVSRTAYVMAKWSAAASIVVVSLLLGMMSSWYYTEQLIGPVALSNTLLATGLFALWMLIIITVTLMLSVWLRSQMAVAFSSLLIAIIASAVTSTMKLSWSPASLAAQAASMLADGHANSGLTVSLASGIALMAVLLVMTAWRFQRMDLGA